MERRSEQNHPTPRYGEDVKWLLKIGLKLGNDELQEFVTTATAVIVNPYYCITLYSISIMFHKIIPMVHHQIKCFIHHLFNH